MAANTERTAETELLAEALGVRTDAVTLRSREPLGAGSVIGFTVDEGEELTYFVDTSGLPIPSEEPVRPDALGDAPGARIWLHPADPHLPALAPAAFGGAARTLLARLGINVSAGGEFVGYRPGRRAVLRFRTAESSVWLKVVRPSRVEGIVRAHTAAVDAGLPLPQIHGWSGEGLIVMASATGSPAAAVSWEPEQLLVEVDRLRDMLATVAWRRPARGAAHRLDWYAHRDVPATVEPLARVRALLGKAERRSAAVVHGDLHFGQLFLQDGAISGLIDIDTLGVGDPAEDEGAFLSHAIVSAMMTSEPGLHRVWDLADAAADRWGRDLTRALTAVHLIGHLIAALDRDDFGTAAALEHVIGSVLDGDPPSRGLRKSPLTEPFDSP